MEILISRNYSKKLLAKQFFASLLKDIRVSSDTACINYLGPKSSSKAVFIQFPKFTILFHTKEEK